MPIAEQRQKVSVCASTCSWEWWPPTTLSKWPSCSARPRNCFLHVCGSGQKQGAAQIAIIGKIICLPKHNLLEKKQTKKQKQYSCYAIKTRAMVQNNLQCSMVTLFLCLTWSNTVQGFKVQLHLVVYKATYRDLLRFHTYRTWLYALWTSAKTVYFFLNGTVHVRSWVNLQ